MYPAPPQKLPQAEGIPHPVGDGPLRIQTLEVADQEAREVYARRQGGLPQTRIVVVGAQPLGEAVEAGLLQGLVELVVEGVHVSLGRCASTQRLAWRARGLLPTAMPSVSVQNISTSVCFSPLQRPDLIHRRPWVPGSRAEPFFPQRAPGSFRLAAPELPADYRPQGSGEGSPPV